MMQSFGKSDLLYKYSWTIERESENQRIIGFSPHYFLYRGEGYEMLPFIRKYMKSRSLQSLETFHKIEEIIKKHLSLSIASHIDIKNWLDQNYVSDLR
jgi:hypothetical protein